MYKVILIDDEPIIVQGLLRSVPWEKYDCEVVDTAGDGLEGKRLIEKHAPDMVFLDICMPQMDGLEMVAALRSEHRNTQIAILTGFRDFDYAKQALYLGVARYLLKPSNMEEIEEAIRFMSSRVPVGGARRRSRRNTKTWRGTLSCATRWLISRKTIRKSSCCQMWRRRPM